jgi:hypothetical protein
MLSRDRAFLAGGRRYFARIGFPVMGVAASPSLHCTAAPDGSAPCRSCRSLEFPRRSDRDNRCDDDNGCEANPDQQTALAGGSLVRRHRRYLRTAGAQRRVRRDLRFLPTLAQFRGPGPIINPTVATDQANSLTLRSLLRFEVDIAAQGEGHTQTKRIPAEALPVFPDVDIEDPLVRAFQG